MTTPAERIRALKLTDEDWVKIPTNHIYDIADAQYTKLLTGLLDIMLEDALAPGDRKEDWTETQLGGHIRQALKEDAR